MESEKGMSVEDYGEIMPGRKVAFYVYMRDGKAEVNALEKCRCMWYEGERE